MQADAVRKLDAVLRRGASQAVRSTRRLSIVSLSAIATAVALRVQIRAQLGSAGPCLSSKQAIWYRIPDSTCGTSTVPGDVTESTRRVVRAGSRRSDSVQIVCVQPGSVDSTTSRPWRSFRVEPGDMNSHNQCHRGPRSSAMDIPIPSGATTMFACRTPAGSFVTSTTLAHAATGRGGRHPRRCCRLARSLPAAAWRRSPGARRGPARRLRRRRGADRRLCSALADRSAEHRRVGRDAGGVVVRVSRSADGETRAGGLPGRGREHRRGLVLPRGADAILALLCGRRRAEPPEPTLSGTEYRFLNQSVRVRATGAQTDGAFGLVDIETPAGAGPPPHRHRDEDEVLVMLRGRPTVTIGPDRREVEPGQLVLLAQGVDHAKSGQGRAAASPEPCATCGFRGVLRGGRHASRRHSSYHRSGGAGRHGQPLRGDPSRAASPSWRRLRT